MRKIKFYLDVGFVGADRWEIVEVDDNTSDEEINEIFKDWLGNFDQGWFDVDET